MVKRNLYLTSILSLLFLTSCLSNGAKQFIESEDTQTEVKTLVEEQLDKHAVPVEVGSREAMYEPVGKGGRNENKIRVDFKTLNKPPFYGMAFVEVDIEAKPRQLLDVIDTGLMDEHGYDLYDAIMEYTFLAAYQTAFTEMKQIHNTFPNIQFEGDDLDLTVGIDVNKSNLTDQDIQNLYTLYRSDKIAKATEKEAHQLRAEYLKTDADEQDKLPSVSIHYIYEGTFNDQKMTDLLDALLEINTLPNATYTVIVEATDFEHSDAEKTYHEKTNEKFTKVMGYLRVTNQTKENRSTPFN